MSTIQGESRVRRGMSRTGQSSAETVPPSPTPRAPGEDTFTPVVSEPASLRAPATHSGARPALGLDLHQVPALCDRIFSAPYWPPDLEVDDFFPPPPSAPKVPRPPSSATVAPPVTTTLHLSGLDVQVETTRKPAHWGAGYVIPEGPVTLRHPLADAPVLRHGWQSWSHNHWFKPGEKPAMVLFPRGKGIELEDGLGDRDLSTRGFGMTLVEGPDGKALLLGSLGINSQIRMESGRLTGAHDGGEHRWYVAYGPQEKVLDDYARLLKREISPDYRIASEGKRIHSMWSSWYSHYAKISETVLRDDMAKMKDLPFEVFQVDDGWQSSVGDWEVNQSRFPSGMASLASEIKATGRKPGLWIAPFIATEKSRIFKEHPDWFVKGEDGKPLRIRKNWGGWYYGLDLTRPEAQDHVRKVIRQAKDWGFELLKLDFLFAAALEGQRSDPKASREEVYRQAVQMIREEAGDDTYLLACGAPIYPSLGVFDGIRVSADTGPLWRIPTPPHVVTSLPSASEAFKNSFQRLWLNPVIQVDPDVVYFQDKNNLISAEHKAISRQLATVCGLKETSDDVSRLTPQQRADLERWLDHDEKVRRKDRYRYEIDGEVVDFEPTLKEKKPYTIP